jgi:hypothetical protein
MWEIHDTIIQDVCDITAEWFFFVLYSACIYKGSSKSWGRNNLARKISFRNYLALEWIKWH